MKKSDIIEMPEYFDRYINLTDDVTCLEALTMSMKELQTLPLDKLIRIGNSVYAEGKWTIKDIFQHLIDTERVFSYRATAFARGDSQEMLSFDENLYAANAMANERSLENIIEELIALRYSNLAQYKSFTPEMLQRVGTGFNGNRYSVLAIGFIFSGHQRWHMKVIEERYFPIIEN